MKIPNVLSALAMGLVLALTAGCASKPFVRPGADFSRYKTFAILPVTAKGTYQDPSLVTRYSGPVQESVVATLTSKGFKQAKADEADLLVGLQFDWLPEQGRIENRMFQLQILDGKTKQLVWSDYWHRTTDAALPEDVVRKGIADMLKPFPPGAK